MIRLYAHLNPRHRAFFLLLAATGALSLALAGETYAQAENDGSNQPAENVETMAPGWNGNLCQPDSVRFCLGLEGHSRDAWVNCMRRHYDQLTSDCQEIMSPSNFKTPIEPEKEVEPAKAAPSLMGQ